MKRDNYHFRSNVSLILIYYSYDVIESNIKRTELPSATYLKARYEYHITAKCMICVKSAD